MSFATKPVSSGARPEGLAKARARLLGTTAIVASLAMVPASALAQTWDGSTSGNAKTGTNWVGDVAPGAADAAVLNNGALPNQPTLNAVDTATYNSLAVSAGTYTVDGDLIVSTTATISNTGTVTIGATGSLTGDVINSATFNNAGTAGAVDNSGTGTNTGTIASLSNSNGSSTFNNSGQITGNVTESAGLVTNTGAIGGTLGVTNGTFNQNAGGSVASLTTIGTFGILHNTGGTLADVNNQGSFNNRSRQHCRRNRQQRHRREPRHHCLAQQILAVISVIAAKSPAALPSQAAFCPTPGA